MNTYRYQFVAKCPRDDRRIVYSLTIKSDDTIMAEDIVSATSGLTGFQEEIADSLSRRFGGNQTIVAVHSGVEVETLR